MPSDLVKAFARRADLSFLEAEKRWKQAKEIAEEETGKTEADGEEFWRYVTGVFKRSMGIMESATALDAAAHEAATSPHNAYSEPTEAQKLSGQYKMGHVRLYGLDISIENPAGSVRSGTAPDGTPWETVMAHHYGYIKGTVGKDKDHLDVFIGPHHDSGLVFIVNQVDEDGQFDEHKVMLGFSYREEAIEGYKANYAEGWTMGETVSMSIEQFKRWAKEGDTSKPAEYGIFESAASLPSLPNQLPWNAGPSVIGRLRGRVLEEVAAMGLEFGDQAVVLDANAAANAAKKYRDRLYKRDAETMREAIANPAEILPTEANRRDASILLSAADAMQNVTIVVEVALRRGVAVVADLHKLRQAEADVFLNRYRREKEKTAN